MLQLGRHSGLNLLLHFGFHGAANGGFQARRIIGAGSQGMTGKKSDAENDGGGGRPPDSLAERECRAARWRDFPGIESLECAAPACDLRLALSAFSEVLLQCQFI